jgi:hypothetical protein
MAVVALFVTVTLVLRWNDQRVERNEWDDMVCEVDPTTC